MSNRYKTLTINQVRSGFRGALARNSPVFKSNSSYYRHLRDLVTECEAVIYRVEIDPRYYSHLVTYPKQSLWYEPGYICHCWKQRSR